MIADYIHKRRQNTKPNKFPSFAASIEIYPWLPYLLISLVALAAASWYLWPNPLEFPMDDTYIHFVYAQNLAETGRLMFNFAGEPGVGSTSILWVTLLAIGYKLGLSLHITAKVLGITALVLVGQGVYRLLNSKFPALVSLASALMVILSGNMLWFALSGMETLLFLGLGMTVVALYRTERWVWMGLLLGLLTLTRPEGLVLAGSLGIIDLWRHRKINTGIMISMGICALICLPWFAYLLVRTGNILPTSAVGKQVSSRIGLRMVFAKTGKLAFLGNMPGLVYPFFWLTYVLEFALGGMALPSPDISLGKLVGNPNYTISVWAILIWLIVVVPLVWIALRRFAFFMRETPSEANGHHWLFSLVAIWVVLHNLVYMFFLPIPGTASRYGAINHMVLWILLALGLYFFHRRSSNWRWVGGGLLILVLANSIYWNNVYDANIEHMNNVRKTAAYYLRDHFSSDDFCAAFDVGAVRFFSQRPVMDLGGLVDSSFGEHYLDGSFDQFLVDQGVSCLIIPGSIGAEKDGWFDFASALGLTQTPLFTLSQVSLFEIDYELWLVGFLPTNNYQASVTIYDLVLSRVPE